MMLFWAGLRGAVGVALAVGFTGENAAALRTTVLVVVVLTVIMFGGTTARMLEVMGIRTGVEDAGDPDSSDDGGMAKLPETGSGEWSSMSPGGRRRGTAPYVLCLTCTTPTLNITLQLGTERYQIGELAEHGRKRAADSSSRQWCFPTSANWIFLG